MRSEFVYYLQIVSLMSQNANLSWKIVVQNTVCGFTYFCGGHKNNLLLKFRRDAFMHSCEFCEIFKKTYFVK